MSAAYVEQRDGLHMVAGSRVSLDSIVYVYRFDFEREGSGAKSVYFVPGESGRVGERLADVNLFEVG